MNLNVSMLLGFFVFAESVFRFHSVRWLAIEEKIESGKINLSPACKIEQMIKKADVPMESRAEVAKELIQKIENIRLLCRTHNLSEAERWGVLHVH